MTHVGQRVEVFWPPEGDDTEGNWYCGELDGYDNAAGYHVTYDDGDEEVLGEEIDGRDDIHLLPLRSPQDEGNNRNPPDEGAHRRDDISGVPEQEGEDGRKGQRGKATSEPDSPTPTGSGLAAMSYREIERPASPPDSGGSNTSPRSNVSLGHSRHRSAGHVADDNGFESAKFGKSSERTATKPTGHDGVGNRSGSAWSSNDDDDDKGATDYDSFEFGSEDEEAGIFGPASSRSSSSDGRGSFYGRNGDHGGNCGHDDDDDDDDEQSQRGQGRRGGSLAASNGGRGGDDSSVEKFSLSGNSSDWTPLGGTDLVGASRRSSPRWRRREDRNRKQPSEAAGDEEEIFSFHNEGARVTTSNTLDKATEACISALRNAMPASAASGVTAPGENHRSLPFHTSPWRTGEGRTDGGGAVVGGSDNPEEVLKALERFVHDTAMLQGVVEGVEHGGGGGGKAALRADGGTAGEEGVFVKISFVEGGLASTTNAMFRCKTLLHTTGYSAPATCSADRGGGGWPEGQFQCETFHGGRLGELANAAVLFSVHRRWCGKGGATLRGLDREGFLGQVVLPVRGAVLGLRPAGIAPGPQKSGVDKEESATGAHTRSSINISSSDNEENNCIVRNTTDSGSWRLLRGEVSGAFQAADRRGRVETVGNTPLVLRLRLSVSLSLKPPEDLACSTERRNRAAAQTMGGYPKEAVGPAAAPYATVGAEREPVPPHGGVVFDETGSRRAGRKGGFVPADIPTRSAGRAQRKGDRRTIRTKRGGGDANGGGNRDKRAHDHGAALLRRRVKRQECIARENERMERRLKVIREAAPTPREPRCYERVGRAPCVPRGGGAGGGAGVGFTEQPRHHHRRRQRSDGPVVGGLHGDAPPHAAGVCSTVESGNNRRRGGHPVAAGCRDSTTPSAGGGEAAAGGKKETAGWRELYDDREALASAVEAAAAEAAAVRGQVEALSAKTLWTEANARRSSLAVASLENGAHGRCASSRTTGKEVSVVAVDSSGAGVVFDRRTLDIDGEGGLVEEGLAAELRRQEELYKALAEARRRAVAAGEAARLAREADLKKLDELRSQLTEAEARQTRHQWRRDNETVTTTPPPIGAAAAVPFRRRESPRDDERSPTRAAGARAAGAAAAGDAARPALDGVKEDRGGGGGGGTLPKDALERAQDLALSLRVEVETLRLEEALGAGTGTDVNVAGTGRAPSAAQEEVAKLKARLKNKTQRLEGAVFDRDAIRAEYQHLIGTGRRSALKESLAWLEHAALQLSDTKLK